MTNTEIYGNWSLNLTKTLSAWHNSEEENTGMYLGQVTGPDWQPRSIRLRLHDDEEETDIHWYVDLTCQEEESDASTSYDDEIWCDTRANAVATINAWVDSNKEQMNGMLVEARAKGLAKAAQA